MAIFWVKLWRQIENHSELTGSFLGELDTETRLQKVSSRGAILEMKLVEELGVTLRVFNADRFSCIPEVEPALRPGMALNLDSRWRTLQMGMPHGVVKFQ
jgi:hypothetical protein